MLLLGLLANPAAAQCFNLLGGGLGGSHWKVAETPHLRVVYPSHLETLADQVAAIAEASHAALGSWFGRSLVGKPRLYLSDADDITNGLAVPLGKGYSCIWVYGNDPLLWTGKTPWLWRVVPHELAHLFHYQAIREQPFWLQQFLARPLPRFWTEGLAQYTTEVWDAQRGEQWLRTAVLEDALSYTDGRSRWNGRLLYAVGHAQTRYLAWKLGDSTLVHLLRHRTRQLGFLKVHDFYKAFQAATGKPYAAFEEEWRRHVNVYYNTLASQMETADSLQGERLQLPLAYIDDVAISPETAHWAILGMPSMRRPLTALYVGPSAQGPWRRIAEGDIRPPVAWSPDGRWLAFARRVRAPEGGLVYDLFLVRADGQQLRRLTYGWRAVAPAFSPEGRQIAFVAYREGRAGLYQIDLDSRAITPLYRFQEPVQIGTLRWHPNGRRLLFDRFVEGQRRDLAELDLETQSLHIYTDGTHDDRIPVWSPDGRRVAFTSLRDGVPNAFVLDPAAGTASRITYLVTGARVLAWLPATSTFPEGQLVLAVVQSKAAEHVYLVDARRRVREPWVQIPAPYAAWTAEGSLSQRLLEAAPDTLPIVRRYAYRSWAQLTPAASLVAPYYLGPLNAGVGGFTVWLEPLGYHTLAAGGLLSITAPRYSLGMLSYAGQRSTGTLGITLYRLPGPAVRYSNGTYVELQSGGEVAWFRRLASPPYGESHLMVRLRYRDRRAWGPSHPARLAGPLPPPVEAQQADLTLRLQHTRQRPYRYNAVHPLDGAGVRLWLLGASPVLGADVQFVRLDVAAYRLWPSWATHRLFAYLRLQAQSGRSLPQDYVGLSPTDELHLRLPGPIPTLLLPTPHERVRGFRQLIAGSLVVFGSLEHRSLLLQDAATQLLGSLRLGATALALFVDGALVRGQTLTKRLGAGVELKNALHLGMVNLTHALGLAYPFSQRKGDVTPELYYRVRASVPF
ncbi:hypothetical protein [Rhodothermus bifroesti]|uniref:hypothetical protein n=1 Tax=Rhodothermus bifroesti TaxID=2823335 RepID=UPI000CB0CEEE|nr:hypothetical protein [Rhodothermus bifroesti]GBD01914.1 Protein TolB [bacterium HR18]